MSEGSSETEGRGWPQGPGRETWPQNHPLPFSVGKAKPMRVQANLKYTWPWRTEWASSDICWPTPVCQVWNGNRLVICTAAWCKCESHSSSQEHVHKHRCGAQPWWVEKKTALVDNLYAFHYVIHALLKRHMSYALHSCCVVLAHHSSFPPPLISESLESRTRTEILPVGTLGGRWLIDFLIYSRMYKIEQHRIYKIETKIS